MIYGAALSLLAFLLEIEYPWVDPVAVPLPGPIDVRWYGLGYLFAFSVGYLLLRRLSRDGFLELDTEAIGDLIFALILGVILGGRIGYILFYDFAAFAANPARIIRIWEGGLSFHGGLLGVMVAVAWFTRTHRIGYLHLGDAVTLAVPPGIFAVRLANFINGELFGRVAGPDVPWAMRFPTDPRALRLLGADRLPLRERELAIERAYENGLWDAVREQVPLRHPSQLYEGLTEGLLLGLILWALYWWTRRRGMRPATGTFGALFLIGYGAFRSFVELFRQPDTQFTGPDDPVGTVLGPLTMGQTLSLSMVLAGVAILVYGWTRRTGGGAAPAPAPRAASRR